MRATRVIREGLWVGIIAYLVVAVFYAAFDAVAARGSLFTVDMLSRAVFREPPTVALLHFPTPVDTLSVSWYNLLHFGVSVTIGLTVVGLVEFAESHSRHRGLVVAVLVAGYVTTIAAVGLLSRGIRPVLPWWSIVTVNTTAVIVAGAWLMRQRPGVAGRLLRSAGEKPRLA